jgi:very-short-patch-repair endonuclease/nucleoside diphosphate kinase
MECGFKRGESLLKPYQKIKIKIISCVLGHYKKLGYDVQVNKMFEIKAEDLSKYSDVEVIVICDYCGKEFSKKNKKYISQRGIVKKDACFDCFSLKQKEVCNIKYSVDSTMQLEDIKLKSKKTIRNNYNVDNAMQCEEIKNKLKKTMLLKYNCEHAQQNPNIQRRTKNTLLKKYGVENPQKQYNYKYHFVNGIKVSKAQIKINNYLNGKLNVYLGGYYPDITLEKDNIIIEYNGSGHNLAVKIGKISQEEFDNKDKKRLNFFISQGWKCLIIENSLDKIISIDYLQSIADLINILKNNNNSNTTFLNL